VELEQLQMQKLLMIQVILVFSITEQMRIVTQQILEQEEEHLVEVLVELFLHL
jgi:hypothetical protein